MTLDYDGILPDETQDTQSQDEYDDVHPDIRKGFVQLLIDDLPLPVTTTTTTSTTTTTTKMAVFNQILPDQPPVVANPQRSPPPLRPPKPQQQQPQIVTTKPPSPEFEPAVITSKPSDIELETLQPTLLPEAETHVLDTDVEAETTTVPETTVQSEADHYSAS